LTSFYETNNVIMIMMLWWSNWVFFIIERSQQFCWWQYVLWICLARYWFCECEE